MRNRIKLIGLCGFTQLFFKSMFAATLVLLILSAQVLAEDCAFWEPASNVVYYPNPDPYNLPLYPLEVVGSVNFSSKQALNAQGQLLSTKGIPCVINTLDNNRYNSNNVSLYDPTFTDTRELGKQALRLGSEQDSLYYRWTKSVEPESSVPGSSLAIGGPAIYVVSQGIRGKLVISRYRYGNSENVSFEGYQIFTTSDASGNVYVLGVSRGYLTPNEFSIGNNDSIVSSAIFSSQISSNVLIDYNLFIIKYNYWGDVVFGKNLGAFDNRIQIASIAADSLGNIYLTGSYNERLFSHSLVDFKPGSGDKKSSYGITNLFLTRYDLNANYSWTKTLESSNDSTNTGLALSADAEGNLFILGKFLSQTVDLNLNDTGLKDTYSSSSRSNYQYFVSKYASNGAYVWSRTFDSVTTALSTSSGYLYVVGSTGPEPKTSNNEYNSNVGKITIKKLDQNGYIRYSSFIGPDTTGVATSVAVDKDSVYVLGYFIKPYVDFSPGVKVDYQFGSRSQRSVFLTKFKSDETYSWTETLNASEAVSVKSNGAPVILTGSNSQDSTDFNPGTGFDFQPSKYYDTLFVSSYVSDASLEKEISGTVLEIDIDSSKLKPLANISIVDTSTGRELAKTDSTGKYAFDEDYTRNGDKGITAKANGYIFSPNSYQNINVAGNNLNFVGILTRDCIKGQLLDYSGNAISYTTIVLSGDTSNTTITDNSGSYMFCGLAQNGYYEVTPLSDFYSFSPPQRSGNLTTHNGISFVSIPKSYNVTSIVGRVADSSGNGKSGVRIELLGTGGYIETDLLGNYAFTWLSKSSSYTVVPSLAGFSFTPSSITLENIQEFAKANFTITSQLLLTDSDFDGVTDAQETLDGTNPQDRGSVLTRVPSTVCSEWNGFLGNEKTKMWNIMEHVNLGSSPMQIRSTLYSIDGVAQSSQDFSIPAGTQFDLIVHDMHGWIRESYGKVCSTILNSGSEGDLDGRMVYYKPKNAQGSSFEFAFAMPFLSGTTGKQFVPFNTFQPSWDIRDRQNFVANWIQVTNLENSKQSGRLIFHAQDGTILGSPIPVELAQGARQDIAGHQFGQDIVGIIEWQPDDTSASIQLRNVRYVYDNPWGVNSFNAAFQLEGLVGSGELLSVTLDAKEASSILEISNTANLEQSIAVNFYKDDGTSLETRLVTLSPFGSVHLIADDILRGGTGIATIQGSKQEGVIAVAMQYGRTSSAGLRYLYGIPARQALGSTLRSSYNTFLNQGCSLLLENPGDIYAQATISMLRYDGFQTLSGELIDIPAHGIVTHDICLNGERDTYGTVTVQAAQANSIVSSIVRIGHNNDYRFPVPVRQ